MIWRDPDTGCGYFLTPQGGMTIRFRADGSIDCRTPHEKPRPVEAFWTIWRGSWAGVLTPSGASWIAFVSLQRSAFEERHHEPRDGSYRASHSPSFVQRGFICPPLTAIPSAFFWPTITTSRLPRVTPV